MIPNIQTSSPIIDFRFKLNTTIQFKQLKILIICLIT